MKTEETADDEKYLGDGLYASFDGWQIKLRAPRGMAGNHEVFIEPDVWERLVVYVNEVAIKDTDEEPRA